MARSVVRLKAFFLIPSCRSLQGKIKSKPKPNANSFHRLLQHLQHLVSNNLCDGNDFSLCLMKSFLLWFVSLSSSRHRNTKLSVNPSLEKWSHRPSRHQPWSPFFSKLNKRRSFPPDLSLGVGPRHQQGQESEHMAEGPRTLRPIWGQW